MTSPPLFHRTNLNLYAADVAYMQQVYGRGWTEHARDIIHQELKAIKQRDPFLNIKMFNSIEELPNGVTLMTGGKLVK